MAFTSFAGRVLFASIFILSAWQELTSWIMLNDHRSSCFCTFNEFGTDGGPAAKSLKLKFDVFSGHVSTHTGFQLPSFEVTELKIAIAAAIAIKGVGCLLFIVGSSLGTYLLLLQQAIATPILYDFYNHDTDKKEFYHLFIKFTQNLALIGALLFFIGMKNSIPRRQLKNKAPKSKTT